MELASFSAGVELHLRERGWLRWEEAQLLAGEGLGRPRRSVRLDFRKSFR